jgi:acylphosphatase
MLQKVHVYYSGRVQGVGFRYTAQDLAQSLGITGWVKNLGDGRVEVVAEGEETALREFLGKLKESLVSYIRGQDIDWQPATGGFADFRITF